MPSLKEFRSRIKNILKKHPYLVAEIEGEIAGYAYTSDFVGRAAYDHSSELTIYLKENMRKMGIGKKLYHALEEISRAQNITNLYACIGYPEKEDEYLTRNSAEFHQHLGYQIVGNFITAAASSAAGITWSGQKRSSAPMNRFRLLSFPFQSWI